MIFIVILSYNSEKDLKECLPSIFESNYSDFKVVLVDNNSTDGSVRFVKENYPKVHVIETGKNLGYVGNNVGIDYAIKSKADFIFLLNPDTILDKDCLANLAKSSNQTSILQPLLLVHKNGKTNKINSTGNYLNFLGISYCDNLGKNASDLKTKELTSASGAAFFVPTNIIKKVGKIDDDFFMYHEDLDLSWRSRLAGFNILLVPTAKVWHKYEFSRNKKKFLFAERNRLFFLLKNFETKTLVLIFPAFVLNEIMLIIFSLLNGWFIYKISSLWQFLLMVPRTVAKRSQIQGQRKVSDKELKVFIGGNLVFSEAKLPLLDIYSKVLNIYWQCIKRLI